MDATVLDERRLKVVPLERAINEFMKHARDALKLSTNTLGTYRGALARLLLVCELGMPVMDLNPVHMQMALALARRPETDAEFARRLVREPSAIRRRGRAESTLNIDKSAYRTFCDWCKAMTYLSPYADPTYKLKSTNRRADESRRKAKRWCVPFEQRQALLKVAGLRHQSIRFAVAMGLYGGRRFSDYQSMRIRDINLDSQTFTFADAKNDGIVIELPYDLWEEFAYEVRIWLGFLGGQASGLDPDGYLLPARQMNQQFKSQALENDMHPGWPMNPARPIHIETLGRDIRLALESIGAPMGQGGFGPHTLRHSCAVWLRDDQGWSRDDISVWLNHVNPATTSIYLGGVDDVRRLRKSYSNGPVDPDERERLSVKQRFAFGRHLVAVADQDEADDAA